MNQDKTYVPELAALDRCVHGRHRQDSCLGCPGRQSEGNQFLQPGQRIGTTLYGDPIIVPEQHERGHSENWVAQREGQARRIRIK